MLKVKELDSQITYQQQLQDHRDEPVVLMILFTVGANDVAAFKAAWAEDAAFTKAQPGFISAQLHQGIEFTQFEQLAILHPLGQIDVMLVTEEKENLQGA